MHEYESGHAWNALTQNQNRRATRGDGVLDGCAVSAGDSTDGVESEVDPGTVVLDDQLCTLEPNAVVHDDGDDLPRRDVVVARRIDDNTAEATAWAGAPGEWPTIDDEEFRYADAWEPQPPDTAGVGGAVLAVVTVEAGATQSSGILHVEDRRREPAPRPRQPWQTGTAVLGPAEIGENDFVAQPLGVPGDSYLHIWMIEQMRFEAGERVAWDPDDSRNWRVGIMEPVDGDSDNSLESTSVEYQIGNYRDGEPRHSFEVGGDPTELYPYWFRLQNFGGEVGAEERWGARISWSIDDHPLPDGAIDT